MQFGRIVRLDEDAASADVGGVFEDEVLHGSESDAETRIDAGKRTAWILAGSFARHGERTDGYAGTRGGGASATLQQVGDRVVKRALQIDELGPIPAVRG